MTTRFLICPSTGYLEEIIQIVQGSSAQQNVKFNAYSLQRKYLNGEDIEKLGLTEALNEVFYLVAFAFPFPEYVVFAQTALNERYGERFLLFEHPPL